MNRHRVIDLSERQRQCLRGIARGLQAKEIASDLGLSYNTVNEHLRSARRLLGVTTSRQAARLLAVSEADNSIVLDQIGVEFTVLDSNTDSADATGAVRNRYNLTILQRIGLTVATAFAAVALAGALLVGADAINRIFVGYGIDISDPPYRK
ncbi:helix-turn-helix domain-containing protein [Sphingopyxis sp. YR583]|uniref:helix-turn-helix domain-containing protein n=1 Tax=Sphingopyxis sp. YR583 TaxID=1881047 RepID=UPI000B8596D8|nr:helix-turn-helix transcriptional regulator [Sphingopyxis sp. YR583]